jgi:hypothetical protein
VSEPIYSRAPDVVWRLGPDRVLVRRIGDRGEGSAADLSGDAALAWIALDTPGTYSEISQRLADAAAASADLGVIESLLSVGWLSPPH